MTRSKTAKPGSEDNREAIIDAAMRLAEGNDWDAVRLSDIAAEAGVTMAQLRSAFDSKTAIINGLMRRIDEVVLDGDDPEMAGEPARDRLFDVLMRRFDALKPYRLALKSIMRAYRRDPFAAVAFNTRARRSMKWMLEAAGIEATGRLGRIRAQGLVFVMARTMPAFLRDKDAGLARTMAALDRALRDGEQVMRTMSTGMRMLGMFGSFVAGMRDRARDRFDDEDDDSFYDADDERMGEPDDEPWTGGPH